MQWLRDLDYSLFRSIHLGWQNPVLTAFFFVVSTSGLGWVQVLLALPTLRKTETKQMFWMVVACVIFVGSASSALKDFFGRWRPSNLAEAQPQETFFMGSFPSGHTTTAFAVATVMWIWFSRHHQVGMARMCWIWAVLVGISRIYRGVHWPTDVFAGACLGIMGGIIVFYVIDALGRRKAEAVVA